VASFTHRPLYPPPPQGKCPWYQSDRRLDGPRSRSGCGGEEENCQPVPGLEPPIIQPIAQRIPLSFPNKSHIFSTNLAQKGLILTNIPVGKYRSWFKLSSFCHLIVLFVRLGRSGSSQYITKYLHNHNVRRVMQVNSFATIHLQYPH
jgi:hypothetical protein